MTATEKVTIYWRPGCGFCSGLLRSLEREGLAIQNVNIWEDRYGATFVRDVTGGNETVPTVQIGSIVLVNPTARDVLRTVAAELPDQVPPDYEPPQPGRASRFVTRLFGG